MDDIKDLFISIIEEAPGIDIADSEFKKMLIDDPELRRKYKEYCREQGTSERNGFVEFCEEYCADRNSIWDSLNDYDNEE
ncbi:MAG: hypothetical protein HDS65_08395 [Bacteroidales bacterium]|nr:hypothetical protein [Bacteroidales bacterium]